MIKTNNIVRLLGLIFTLSILPIAQAQQNMTTRSTVEVPVEQLPANVLSEGKAALISIGCPASSLGNPIKVVYYQEYRTSILPVKTWTVKLENPSGGFKYSFVYDDVFHKVIGSHLRPEDPDSNSSRVKNGEQLALSKEQATQKAKNVLSFLNVSGQWRNFRVFFYNDDGWTIYASPMINGYMLDEEASVSITPFDTEITFVGWPRFMIVQNATNNSVSATQARQIATNALNQSYGLSGITPRADIETTVWKQIPGTMFWRLAHQFIFEVPEGGSSDAVQAIQIIVDFETGEIWSIKELLDSFSVKLKSNIKLSSSPRIELSQKMTDFNESQNIGRALISGTPIKKMLVKKPQGHSFIGKTLKDAVSFTFDAKKYELYWEAESKGKWAGVKLSKAESDKLAAWLKIAKL
jgi:hypothetical protein